MPDSIPEQASTFPYAFASTPNPDEAGEEVTLRVSVDPPRADVTAAPGALRSLDGMPASATLSIVPRNGFRGTLALSVSGAPSSAQATLEPATLTVPDGATAAQQSAARAKADAALRRIREGESFAKVARDVSDGPTAKEGGDLGYFRRGQMLAELEQAAFALQPGQISSLIRVTGNHGGFHLVTVEDRRQIAARPLAEVQEEIRNRIAGESVMKEREHYLAQLRKTAQVDEKL